MVAAGTKRKIKFWRYYQQWYETYKLGDVAQVTYNKYVLVGKKLKEIAPDLMLSNLTRTELQKIINEYGRTHERQTVTDFYHHIGGAIRDAVYEGWIKRNPCYKIKMTSMVQHKDRRKWLEMEEVHKIEKVFDQDTTGFGDFFDFSMRTGTRFAETLAITPDDVDEQHLTVDINKSFNYKGVINTDDGKGFMPTKNKFSVRQLPIDYKALIDLKKHMDGLQPNEPIWVHWWFSRPSYKNNWRGKKEIHNSTFNHELAKMCKEAGVNRITVHGLRHTHASILIANRVSVQTVAKRLGHADTETTQKVYIHLLQSLENEDNNKIMSIMTGL